MRSYVVDTNVAIISNDTTSADPKCVLNSIQALRDVLAGRIVLDAEMLIFEEYKKNFSFSGQNGPGHAFFKEVADRRYNPQLCELVSLDPTGPDEFAAFPEHEDLQGFHRKDRKFVACALASENNPLVVFSADANWRSYSNALKEVGVKTKDLCPPRVNSTAKGRQKQGSRAKGGAK